MPVVLEAATKIFEVKAGTCIHPACLPYWPACLVCAALVMLK